MTKDRNQARLANESFYEAFERLDISRMQDVWRRAAHVKCIHPGGALLTGYEAVLKSWEEIFSQTLSIHFDLSNISVELKGDVAWITLTEQVTLNSTDGMSKGLMIATNIFEWAEDRWQMIHHHAAPAPLNTPANRSRQTLH